ncbi:hypothetical protein EJP02_426 [Escherichia phage EJP2]|nr:hypothetical protein EJP02_426 [Escherichia phage EJP2]
MNTYISGFYKYYLSFITIFAILLLNETEQFGSKFLSEGLGIFLQVIFALMAAISMPVLIYGIHLVASDDQDSKDSCIREYCQAAKYSTISSMIPFSLIIVSIAMFQWNLWFLGTFGFIMGCSMYVYTKVLYRGEKLFTEMEARKGTKAPVQREERDYFAPDDELP